MPTIPPVIGRYQVLERLAVGGMAELFKARLRGEHGFEKLVAIKKILPHLAGDPQFVAMFIDEARITAQLDHAHIVQVFELGTDADTPYITMQYVDGVDVLGLLRVCARTRMRLPPALAALIVHDILDGLDHAHTATDRDGRPLAIIHRDVSPGNLLVSRRGDVKLTDFGIAWAVERRHKSEAGVLKGKYGYLSPEQVDGADFDARSDLFSVGTVLAEMIMMRRLFSAAADLDTLLSVREARLDRLDEHAGEFPLELRVICEKALQRWPEDRWPSAAAFRDVLADWLWRNGRPSARDLGEFVSRVVAAPPATPPDDLDVRTLSGPATRVAAAEARAAAASGRKRYLAAAFAGEGVPEHVADEDSSAAVALDEVTAPAAAAAPAEVGDLRVASPLRLIHRLARERHRGLLVLEGRAGILKEAFFADGHPQFVSSNLASERLGEFLVAQGVLTTPQLARAVAAMPEFQGRLSDTLVALGLLRPLEAFRLLARQVGAKLIDACTWQKGRYRWYPGRNPPKARPLHLDAYEILGAGAMQLDLVFVEDWVTAHASAIVHQLDDDPIARDRMLARFGLADAPWRVHALLDGRTSLSELVQRVRAPEARGNFVRVLHLLVQTDLAALRP